MLKENKITSGDKPKKSWHVLLLNFGELESTLNQLNLDTKDTYILPVTQTSQVAVIYKG